MRLVDYLLCSLLAITTGSTTVLAEGSTLQQTLSPILPLVLMFGVFYFLLIRPQQKKQKSHQQFLENLKKGDRVVTNGGMIGTIKNVGEKLITLEIDSDVCIKLLRNHILESASSFNNTQNQTK